MGEERDLTTQALERTTDFFWSPWKIFGDKGTTQPHGLTPWEASVCNGLSLVFSRKHMGGVIQFLYGPEARDMFEVNFDRLRKEPSPRD